MIYLTTYKNIVYVHLTPPLGFDVSSAERGWGAELFVFIIVFSIFFSTFANNNEQK
jgi:hypothetical protein